jgi:hypothetical protein
LLIGLGREDGGINERDLKAFRSSVARDLDREIDSEKMIDLTEVE